MSTSRKKLTTRKEILAAAGIGVTSLLAGPWISTASARSLTDSPCTVPPGNRGGCGTLGQKGCDKSCAGGGFTRPLYASGCGCGTTSTEAQAAAETAAENCWREKCATYCGSCPGCDGCLGDQQGDTTFKTVGSSNFAIGCEKQKLVGATVRIEGTCHCHCTGATASRAAKVRRHPKTGR